MKRSTIIKRSLVAILLTAGFTSGAAFASANTTVEFAPEPDFGAGGTLDDYVVDIYINGEPFSDGPALEVKNALYIDVAIVRAANIQCGRVIERNDRKLCAIPVTKIVRSGRRLDVTVPIEAFQLTQFSAASGAKAIPEISPSNLAFLNYNISPGWNRGRAFLNGGINAGFRADKNAFDLGGFVTQNSYVGFSGNGSQNLATTNLGSTQLTLSNAAYRRNWFDERLSLVIGRSTITRRGYVGGSTFDGIGFSRENLDNQGDIVISRNRMLDGINRTAGVLTYRVGGVVYKQLPIAAGPFAIDPTLLDGLPTGGQLEITGIDGRITELNLPFDFSRQRSFFAPGAWDGNFEIGQMLTAGGVFSEVLNLGSRVGLSHSITTEFGLQATTNSIAIGSSADIRLPENLGVLAVAGAWQSRGSNPSLLGYRQPSFGYILSGSYEYQIGKVDFNADYQRYNNGGIIVGGYDGFKNRLGYGGNVGELSIGSSIRENWEARLNGPVFSTGLSGSVGVRSTTYGRENERERFATLILNGRLGRIGSWGTYARAGRDRSGADLIDANIYLSIPLGGRHRASLSYNTNRRDGKKMNNDRYVLGLSGSTSNEWAEPDNYNLQVDNQGFGTFSYDRKFRNFASALYVQRDTDGGVSGSAVVRGSAVYADDTVILGNVVGNSPLVVKATDLPNENVYYQGYTQPTTRTNSAGYALVSNLRPYKNDKISVDNANGPLTLEVPNNILTGAIHPYRGYVVEVATVLKVPARIFANVPTKASGSIFADIEGTMIPVEPDSSFYVEDITKVKRDIVISWQTKGEVNSCVVPANLISMQTEQGKNEVVRTIEKLPCLETGRPVLPAPTEIRIMESPGDRLLYPKVTGLLPLGGNVALETSVTSSDITTLPQDKLAGLRN